MQRLVLEHLLNIRLGGLQITAICFRRAPTSVTHAPIASAAVHQTPFQRGLSMHSCDFDDSSQGGDVFWIDTEDQAKNTDQSEFSITDLAKEFGTTLRALRFYESRGLLTPVREGRKRIFSRADRDRLALILKGKKLGFTLTEISQMIEAQSGRASQHALKMSSEKCLGQIALFERQMREANEALAELRGMHRLLEGSQLKKAAS
jgi:DNA-binding transcriptional MerR regulator